MAWLRQNYSSVNVLPYGSIIGGYRALLEGSHGGLETTVRLVLIACIALPAILPPLAILLGGVSLWRNESGRDSATILTLLLPAAAALAITAFPRADVMHLAFIAALPYVLVVSALASLLPARPASWLAIGSMVLAADVRVELRAGLAGIGAVYLRLPASCACRMSRLPMFERLIQTVRPGDSLFVYPYMPMQYVVTQARNPTRYSYLMPGMMTRIQETEALGELEARPPEWLLYMQLSPQDFHARVSEWSRPGLALRGARILDAAQLCSCRRTLGERGRISPVAARSRRRSRRAAAIDSGQPQRAGERKICGAYNGSPRNTMV